MAYSGNQDSTLMNVISQATSPFQISTELYVLILGKATVIQLIACDTPEQPELDFLKTHLILSLALKS